MEFPSSFTCGGDSCSVLDASAALSVAEEYHLGLVRCGSVLSCGAGYIGGEKDAGTARGVHWVLKILNKGCRIIDREIMVLSGG